MNYELRIGGEQMIKTKADLKYYLVQTKIAYGIQKRSFLKGLILRWLFPDNNYEFMVNLRKLEFWLSQRGGGGSSCYALLSPLATCSVAC